MNTLETQAFWLSETFWIVLIIVVGLLGIAYLFRGSKLKGMKFKGGGMVSVHSPLGARASRPLKWRPRWPLSQEKAGGSERLRGMNAEMNTHEPPMQEIKGNVLKGKKNVISTHRGDTHIRDNTLDGENQKIDVKNQK